MKSTYRIGPTTLGILLAVGLMALSTFAASAGSPVDTPVPPMPPTNDTLTCNVHHVPLIDEQVRITYGLPAFNEQGRAALQVQDSLFPHAIPYVLGGCIIEKDSPKMRLVHYCPVCRVARNAWMNGYEAAQHHDEDR